MGTQTKKTCVNCNRSEEKFICAQCLPLLIHKTHLLVEKFPGIELPQNTEH